MSQRNSYNHPIYKHGLTSIHPPYIPRWAINRVYQALACKPEEVIGCLALILAKKQQTPSIEAQKQAASLLGHCTLYATKGTDFKKTQTALLHVATANETPLTVAKHAANVGYNLAQFGNRHALPAHGELPYFKLMTPQMSNHRLKRGIRRHLFSIFHRLVPEIMPFKDLSKKIVSETIDYLDSFDPSNRDEEQAMDVLEMVVDKAPTQCPDLTVIAINACTKLAAEHAFLSPHAHARAIKVATTNYSGIDNPAGQKLCIDLLTHGTKDREIAGHVIEGLRYGHLRRPTYAPAVQMLPNVFELARSFNDEALYTVAHETARTLSNPEHIEQFLRRDEPFGQISRPTAKERLNLRHAFIDISTHPYVPAGVRATSLAIADYMGAASQAQQIWEQGCTL